MTVFFVFFNSEIDFQLMTKRKKGSENKEVEVERKKVS